MKLDHISYSGLRLYRNCKKAFQLHYTQGKKALPSKSMHAGTIRHEKIAKYISSGKKDEISERLASFCEPFRNEKAEVEKQFKININGLDIIGYIDACFVGNGTVANIVDWKTNKGMQDVEQLKLYSLALQEENPFIEFFICYFYYLEQDFYDKYIFQASDIDKYRLQIEKEVAEIQAMEGKQKPSAGQHCKHCEFALQCAEARQYDIAIIRTQEQAVELAQRLYMLESALSKGKALLEEYVRSGNEVVVGDHKWTLVQSKPSFKLKKLTKAEIEYYSSRSKIEQVEPKKIEKENLEDAPDAQYLTKWIGLHGRVGIINTPQGYQAVDGELKKIPKIGVYARKEDLEKELDEVLSKRRGYENITENKIDTPKAGIIPENESEKGKNIETNSNEMLGPRDRENKAEDQETVDGNFNAEIDADKCVFCHSEPCKCNELASFEEFAEIKRTWCEKLGKSKEDFEKDRKNFSKGSTKNSYKTYFAMKEYAEKILKLMGGNNENPLQK